MSIIKCFLIHLKKTKYCDENGLGNNIYGSIFEKIENCRSRMSYKLTQLLSVKGDVWPGEIKIKKPPYKPTIHI